MTNIDLDPADEFVSNTLYETELVTVAEMGDGREGWFQVIVKPGATISDIQSGLNVLPEGSMFTDGDCTIDGTSWLDFS